MKAGVIQVGTTCWQQTRADESSVLVDAETYYASFCRAALLARRYIYLTGWQFDTKARLLRPSPDAPPVHPIEFLPFLDYLCERTPSLEIFITAWDYSFVYALEREWLQKLKFAFQSHSRVHFEFLNHPEAGGCHHQKLAIVDGQVAFLGGLDLCDARWDTRAHTPGSPARIDVHGKPYKPFHDIQVALRGPVLRPLVQLFREGWQRAHGQPLPEHDALGQLDAADHEAFALGRITQNQGLVLRAREVAISRTEFVDAEQPVTIEVQSLFEQAIAAAERLIYIETQYFTSRALVEALCRRLADPARGKLQLLLVMPDGADSPKEDFVLGDRQRAVRRFVAEVAKLHGHEFRLLMSSGSRAPHATPATFIHSKLMIVDDEFLTIGSANCTNRSMRVDRELNVAYEATRADGSDAELCDDIRTLRTSLLAEHAGLDAGATFSEINGLIGRVDETCADPSSKLRCQALPEPTSDNPLLIAIFDPSAPLDWSTFDQTVEQAFDFDEGFIKKSAQKVGQRLGVVDIE